MVAEPTPSNLFPCETLSIVEEGPVLTAFFKGTDPQKPLVVLIPGELHNARIFYGHPGSKEDDFLTYWLRVQGYSVLAVSYPLETQPSLMPASVPSFGVEEWGRQTARMTSKNVETEEGYVSQEIVVVGWSMAGRIATRVSEALRSFGLTPKLFIALAATPGLYGSTRPEWVASRLFLKRDT